MAKLTHCPSCSAKLPDRPLSICPYCVMPLELGGAAGNQEESQNRERIAKIEANDGYEAALAHRPIESKVYMEGGRRIFRGKLFFVIAIVFVGAGSLLSAAQFAGIPAILGYIIAASGIWHLVKGAAMRKNAVALPVIKRTAMILDRTSDTTLAGWTGNTSYTFTIEFKDSTVGEFLYPGRGSNEEPYVNGLTGIAFTRGPILLEFKHLRV
jgi:hypothetical protein